VSAKFLHGLAADANNPLAAEFTALFLNAGRRVELIRAFRRAFERFDLAGRIITTDIQGLAPALYEGDVRCLLPHSRKPEFIDSLLRLCEHEHVNLIVPLVDPDLPVLARNRDRIEAMGARVLISSAGVIEICQDKSLTATFLTKHDFPTPKVLTLQQARDYPLPLFIKPRRGSSSDHAFKINTAKELEFFANYVPEPLIQEFMPGDEFTVDTFLDNARQPLIAVARRRLKVRSGEMSIGRVERDGGLESLASDVTRTLGVVGPANVQMIRSRDRVSVIEINPRFGGGSPLSIAAGAPLADWCLRLASGRDLGDSPAALRDMLIMMRFDDSVFMDAEQILT